MFLDFFYALKRNEVPISLTEWMTLMEAMKQGLHGDSLDGFYNLARMVVVKDVAKYDGFDLAFAETFKGMVPAGATAEELLDWLEDSIENLHLTEEEMEHLKRLTPEELMAAFEEILKKQKERHNGGSHWIGTGGTSPYGKGGSHPTGISLGENGRGTAMMKAMGRGYKGFRSDRTLDVRQMTVALKKLRALRREGEEVLDLDETIDKTCRDAGEISLVFGRERENQVRLILAMDTGGSMEPFRRLVEQLFSAASALNHFKEFKPFYFHNCVYENLYTDVREYKYEKVDDLIRQSSGEHYRLVMVGDAAMAPFELMIPNGYLERKRTSNIKGIDRLRMLAKRFPKRVWLNPMDEREWRYNTTVEQIAEIFPMFPLTLSGLDAAIKELR